MTASAGFIFQLHAFGLRDGQRSIYWFTGDTATLTLMHQRAVTRVGSFAQYTPLLRKVLTEMNY